VNVETSLSIPVDPGFIDALAARVTELLAAREPDPEPFITARQAAAHLACAPGRIYALAETTPSRIPVHRDGSRLLFRRSELDEFVAQGGAKRP
jgi:excisionase family DNA binding protein